MAGSRKRKLDEWVVSEMEESAAAEVHGVVTELSPVKVSRKNSSVKYFDAKLSDGRKVVRLVSFDPTLRESLEQLRSEGSTVAVSNCQVKDGRDGEKEIVATTRTKVQASPRKMGRIASVSSQEEPKLVKVNDVSDTPVNEHVTVVVKVFNLSAPAKVTTKDGKELCKQECVVCDESGCVRLVLWEENVGVVKEGCSYRLKGVVVRVYGGAKFLSLGVRCVVENVGDIGAVAEVECDEEVAGNARKVVVGEIDGVLFSEEFASCVACKAKVKNVNDVVGECTKCGMIMKTAKCKMMPMVKVVVCEQDGKQHVVTIFEEVLVQIVDGVSGDSTTMKLLNAPTHKFLVDNRDIVYSAQKL